MLVPAALVTGCSMKELPPVATPSMEVPRVEDAPTTPPAATSTRVVIDANGTPARVLEVTGELHGYGYVSGHRGVVNAYVSRPVCASVPCVADLAKGDHTLLFAADDGREETADVRLGDAPKAVRHAFGGTDFSALWGVGILTSVMGVLALTFSWLPPVIGNERAQPQGTRDTANALGAGLAIGGGVALVGGIVMAIVGRPEHTPGATAQWNLPPVAPPAGVAAPPPADAPPITPPAAPPSGNPTQL